MNYPENVEKYLKKYSIPGHDLEMTAGKLFNNIIVIPAISELDNIRTVLASLADSTNEFSDETLVIFVVNNLESSETAVKENNLKTLNLLRDIINREAESTPSPEISISGLSIGLVDAASPGREFPENNGGVGLARKTGMDLALKAFDYGSPAKKILICTDADCTFEKNYLTEIVRNFNARNLSAAVVNYSHDISGEDDHTSAIICYEYYLRYYALFLKYAGSPFAFHTIGSTMCCDHESYIKVEGMNKKKAAEDFYFLEKLAKQVDIQKISTTTVYPSGRGSWRVPFGTGQRVNRFLAGEQDEYQLYNPENFEILKKWIDALNHNSDLVSYYLEAAENIHPMLYRFLVKQEFDRAFSKILNKTSDVKQINRQKKFWFDGFRTLKLIHFLRDNAHPNINTFDAIDILFEKIGISANIKREKDTLPELPVQKKYLELLKKSDI